MKTPEVKAAAPESFILESPPFRMASGDKNIAPDGNVPDSIAVSAISKSLSSQFPGDDDAGEDAPPRSTCFPFGRAQSSNRNSLKETLDEGGPSKRKLLTRNKSSKVQDGTDDGLQGEEPRSFLRMKSRTQSASRKSGTATAGGDQLQVDSKNPALLPSIGGSPWNPTQGGQHADIFSKNIGEFSISKLDPQTHCCNGVVALVVNSLKFQLLRLSRVVDVVRRYKQYLTTKRVEDMYDWIEELQKNRFLPLLATLRDDVLPELGKVSSIPESSLIHYEKRSESFAVLENELNSLVASSDALTPRLPKGERVHVLYEAYWRFEAAMLDLLNQVEIFGIPKRLPGMRVQKQLQELERHIFDMISYSAGSVESANNPGTVSYSEELYQHMRGVLTAWMSRSEIDALRSRLGIRFYNFRGARSLREAKGAYRRTPEGRFAADFIAGFVADECARSDGAEKMDQQILKKLNELNVRRLMQEVNGQNLDLSAVDLEDVTGDVVSENSDEEDVEYLVFRNVYEPSPGSSPASNVS